jgi:hypothetical protein
VPTQVGPVDQAAVIAQKDELIADMWQHKYVDLADHYGFEIIHESDRRLADPGYRWDGGVGTGGGRELQAAMAASHTLRPTSSPTYRSGNSQVAPFQRSASTL